MSFPYLQTVDWLSGSQIVTPFTISLKSTEKPERSVEAFPSSLPLGVIVFAYVIVWLHGLWGQVLLTGFIILSPSAWIMNASVLELLHGFWNNIPWFQIALNQEHRNMLSFAPDYDHLPLVAKVEVFDYALETTEGNDLARVFILPLCVYCFCSAVTIVHKLHRAGFYRFFGWKVGLLRYGLRGGQIILEV